MLRIYEYHGCNQALLTPTAGSYSPTNGQTAETQATMRHYMHTALVLEGNTHILSSGNSILARKSGLETTSEYHPLLLRHVHYRKVRWVKLLDTLNVIPAALKSSRCCRLLGL